MTLHRPIRLRKRTSAPGAGIAALAVIVAALALAAPTSAAVELSPIFGNGHVMEFGLGPKWVAWVELTGDIDAAEDDACVKAAHLDVGPASEKTLWCDPGPGYPGDTGVISHSYRGVAVGTRHIVAALGRVRWPYDEHPIDGSFALWVYDIDTGRHAVIQRGDYLPSDPQLDGTRLIWTEIADDRWRVMYVDLSQPSWVPVELTMAHEHAVGVAISGGTAVYLALEGEDGDLRSIWGKDVGSGHWHVWGAGSPLHDVGAGGNRIVFAPYDDARYALTSLDGNLHQTFQAAGLRSIAGLDYAGSRVAIVGRDGANRHVLQVGSPGRAPAFTLALPSSERFVGFFSYLRWAHLVQMVSNRFAVLRSRSCPGGAGSAQCPDWSDYWSGDLIVGTITPARPGPSLPTLPPLTLGS
jgi:hypothetical protein